MGVLVLTLESTRPFLKLERDFTGSVAEKMSKPVLRSRDRGLGERDDATIHRPFAFQKNCSGHSGLFSVTEDGNKYIMVVSD